MVDLRTKPDDARWTHTCAWNGHELGENKYLDMSAHERVCRLHHPEFATWLRDKSKTMYRVAGDDDVLHIATGQKLPGKMSRFLPVKPRARWSTPAGA